VHFASIKTGESLYKFDYLYIKKAKTLSNFGGDVILIVNNK